MRSGSQLSFGDGAEREEHEPTRELGLRSVTFAGRLPREQLPGWSQSATVTVATQRDLPLLGDALSTKVLEYMAAARPVVAAASGWTAKVITRAEAGVVCPPERPQALADALAEVAGDPKRARTMGLNGRRYVDANLARRVAVERLERALGAIATSRR